MKPPIGPTIIAPFFVKARLREGVTVAQAKAAMDVLAPRLADALPLAGVDPRELEDLLDHLGQAPPFVPDGRPVDPHLGRIADEAVGQVLPRRDHDRDGRAQLVGDAGHELHVLCGQAPRALAGERHHGRAGPQQEQGAEADGQVAAARVGDDLLERANEVGIRACISKDRYDDIPDALWRYGPAA